MAFNLLKQCYPGASVRSTPHHRAHRDRCGLETGVEKLRNLACINRPGGIKQGQKMFMCGVRLLRDRSELLKILQGGVIARL